MTCKLEEDETCDLARYVQGLRPNILENMNYCKTNQEAYLEALCVERLLRRSRMQQCRQRTHAVERLFTREDNPIIVV